jgi:hypothetical protein
VKGFISKISGAKKIAAFLREEIERSRLLAAQTLVRRIRELDQPVNSFEAIEFSAFSQWGDDGIIQYLLHFSDVKTKTFIEFGVGNYLEANTRFLLLNNNWRGLVMDGSRRNVQFIREDNVSWKYDLTSVAAFITRENINSLIAGAGFAGHTGILHIDLDGNDYWIWESIECIVPEMVIMEYNSVFGNRADISVPYDSTFVVNTAHYSNLYFGASLKAMCHLAQKKGYVFVGSNTNGNNAYFIRRDKLGAVKEQNVDTGFVVCNFRQNRDPHGKLTLTRDDVAVRQAGKLPVVRVSTGETHPLEMFL